MGRDGEENLFGARTFESEERGIRELLRKHGECAGGVEQGRALRGAGRTSGKFNYAAALSIILALVVGTVSALFYRLTNKAPTS